MCMPEGPGPPVVLFPLAVASTAGWSVFKEISNTNISGVRRWYRFFLVPPQHYIMNIFKHSEKLTEM